MILIIPAVLTSNCRLPRYTWAE